MIKVTFNTASSLKRLIGRELITSNTIAFFELIKNSYDAGSLNVYVKFVNFQHYEVTSDGKYLINDKTVKKDTIVSTENSKILIKDDGIGMSKKEVLDYWMLVGTDHKVIEQKIVRPESDIDRVVNGEKGIGRFGCDKIAAKLNLKSIDKTKTEKTVLAIDWDEFEETDLKFNEVEMELNTYHKKYNNSGVLLSMTELRDDWTISDVEKLKRELKKLVTPFDIAANDFQVYFTYNGIKELIVNDSFAYMNTYIEAKICNNGKLDYSIIDNGRVYSKKSISSDYNFGEMEIKIYYLDRASKIKFKKNMGITKKHYGNLKLFRDNFRILPYGDYGNDWLGIDTAHAQGTFRTFGTRDLLGYVQIFKGNSRLLDTTNRQGLVEDTDEFDQFYNAIWDCIRIFEKFHFNKITNNALDASDKIHERIVDIKEEMADESANIIEYLESIGIPNGYKEKITQSINNQKINVDHRIKEIVEVNTVLKNQVNTMSKIVERQTFFEMCMHVILNRFEELSSNNEALLDVDCIGGIPFHVDKQELLIKSIAGVSENVLNFYKASKINFDTLIMTDVIDSVFKAQNRKLSKYKIKYKLNYNDSFTRINGNELFLKDIFDNLINNSVKELKNNSLREILVKTYQDGQFLNIDFCDSGNGIPFEDWYLIFNINNSNTGGSGIGLAMVKEVVKMHKGNIELIEEKDLLDGACFRIKLPIKYIN